MDILLNYFTVRKFLKNPYNERADKLCGGHSVKLQSFLVSYKVGHHRFCGHAERLWIISDLEVKDADNKIWNFLLLKVFFIEIVCSLYE